MSKVSVFRVTQTNISISLRGKRNGKAAARDRIHIQPIRAFAQAAAEAKELI